MEYFLALIMLDKLCINPYFVLLSPGHSTYGVLLSRLGRFFLPGNFADPAKQAGYKILANDLLVNLKLQS
jgi:hypothetical protein